MTLHELSGTMQWVSCFSIFTVYCRDICKSPCKVTISTLFYNELMVVRYRGRVLFTKWEICTLTLDSWFLGSSKDNALPCSAPSQQV